MKKVLIVGASGNIAGRVAGLLGDREDVELTLFARNARRVRKTANSKIVEGDVLDYDTLRSAVAGQDVVYGNLAGAELGAMARNIVRAMNECGVRRLVFICSIGIYDEPPRAILKPYRSAADEIESSDLDYTILRPAWFTGGDEVDYEITRKGEPEKGSVISQTSLAALIARIIDEPGLYSRESIGVNKPGS